MSRERNPSDVDTIYNVSGASRTPRHEDPRRPGPWIGGGVAQWVEGIDVRRARAWRAAAFIYLVPPGDIIDDPTLNLWAHEVVPAVREGIADR